MTNRTCGGCTACCHLLPMKAGSDQVTGEMARALIKHGIMTAHDLATMIPTPQKPAGERCPHERYGKGCAIYNKRPFGCHVWSCRWLVNDDTDDQLRPDRSGYVLDLSPDYVQVQDNETGKLTAIQVVQVWAANRDVVNDPRLRAYLERRARENVAGLIRFNERDATLLLAPAMSSDGQWHTRDSNCAGAKALPQHTPEQIEEALGPIRMGLME